MIQNLIGVPSLSTWSKANLNPCHVEMKSAAAFAMDKTVVAAPTCCCKD
jgi:hypothetical protein